MNARPRGGWWWMLWLGVLLSPGFAADLKNRSTSRSGQFIVYCDDRDVRSRVVSSIEELKTDVLRLLQESDNWDFPIVVSIDPAEPGVPVPPVSVQLISTISGPKIDVAVKIGDNPAKVFLHRHILRAIFLEMAYRDRVALKPGEPYTEPPWWLADGFFQTIRRREEGTETDIFKSIVNTDKLPELEKFLLQPPTLIDTAAGKVDRACAMCLVEALLALPNGAQNMGRYIRRSPDAARDPLGMLAVQFPVLSGSPQSLAKWWALQLARFASNNRWEGMTLPETEKELTKLLSIEVVMDKTGRTQKFALEDFSQFVKLPGAQTGLNVTRVKIAALTARANPLFRPIIAEYEQICSRLSIKKTSGIAERIAGIERYRRTLLQRMDAITDYVNWYEATQAEVPEGEFAQYLNHAKEVRAAAAPKPLPPPDRRITEYLDSLEKDFQPLLPHTIPGISPSGAASR